MIKHVNKHPKFLPNRILRLFGVQFLFVYTIPKARVECYKHVVVVT